MTETTAEHAELGRICALVPMRHSSERVPGKNYRPFADRPLFHHVLGTLLEVDEITRILVDTDSPVIREQAAASFPQVEIIDRPHHLRGGETPMTAVLQHDVTQIDEPWILQTHSTNPLLRSATIASAVERLASSGGHDSLFSVTRLQTRLYAADGKPLNHDPEVLMRTQDLPPVYEENSNLYLFPRRLALEEARRIGDRPLLFEMDAFEAMDIDTETDFVMAEAMYRLRGSDAR